METGCPASKPAKDFRLSARNEREIASIGGNGHSLTPELHRQQLAWPSMVTGAGSSPGAVYFL